MWPVLSQVQAVAGVLLHEQGGRSCVKVLEAPWLLPVQVSEVDSQELSAALSSQVQMAVLSGV
ncbi:MAG TPA: hypothetical protein VGC79_34090 [Polyangiaceae bacterium]